MRHSVVVGALLMVAAGLWATPAGAAPTSAATAAQAERASGGWYTELPASMKVCDNATWKDGPSSAPSGAIVVPEGDNLGVDFGQAGKTYWFAPGTHTLGDGEYSQIKPGNDSVFIGAPGAVLDGRRLNKYAFGGVASNVRIAYLEIRNFGGETRNHNEGVVNHDSGTGWVMEHLYAHHNDGAAVFLGSANTIRHSCLKENGQYGISMYKAPIEGDSAIKDLVVHNNEIAANNQHDWESEIEGCGCTGGVKFWDVNGATVTQNYVHDNLSVGLWADTNNIDFLFDRNWIEHNESIGLWYEISYNATVTRNVFKRNAWVTGNENLGSPAPAIYISESGGDARLASETSGSADLNINDNYFEDNFSGITIFENTNRFCNSNGNTSTGYCTPFVDPTVIPEPHDGDYLDPINATHPCYTSIANEPFRSDCRWHSRNVKVFGNEFRFDQANVPCAGTYCGVQALYAQGADNLPWMPYTVAEIQQSVMHTSGNSFHDNTYVGNWKFAKGWGETVSWNAWRSAPFNQEAGSTLNGVTDPPPVPNALDEDTATLEGSLGQWDAWYGSAVQRAAEAAHGGAYGLRIDVTEGGGWGVQLGNWPGFDAAPGGKRVSVWARQGTPGISTATLRLRWYDAGQQALRSDEITLGGLSASWQEFTAQLTAPTGTATVALELTGGTGGTGASLHLDDIVVADQR
ncbi:parallel beta helix pectate lyase-like protein [Nonomuraea fuscirosea]|uniref:Parallel beta helix pectate lyase-like protein n=1 Tax=Nonomuraea fuscirosea TaxID=1291556 RepID=A0A2T0MSS4_9ACTN|nr:right-handed parallel beta-helix repeat-containing protein [Nonomuraea fuscirosea]PRX61666.1 parallel beta helix pectate lyase-like protein [Nonomuraea fuscirosea]